MEKREKIHRKARSRSADLMRETGAVFVYTVVMIDAGGGQAHMIDAMSGEKAPNMGDFLRTLASAHDAQDGHVSGDVGYRQ
jgi:hypothetical protein